MVDGAGVAIEMLTAEQRYLYPKIFHLVMADAAFNDSGLFVPHPLSSMSV